MTCLPVIRLFWSLTRGHPGHVSWLAPEGQDGGSHGDLSGSVDKRGLFEITEARLQQSNARLDELLLGSTSMKSFRCSSSIRSQKETVND
ncbi:hypothetical protein Hypma_016575 [Hypsizygus marmoreus]|uniref:Uncharacterized protein n=1 Tax=Hypsizygus marmoreus TaxID=39966 RepID=A0A369IXM2_HYPMA|nr:hypothetical protein Hypma_016575 [Hypsizygus marmoreus]